jgi:hypothetical protein
MGRLCIRDQDPGQGLVRREAEFVPVRLRLRLVLLLKDEIGPEALAPRGGLDEPADAQLAGRCRHAGLLVGQTVSGGPKSASLVRQVSGQRCALIGDGRDDSRHAGTLS